jgi:glycosyltransferase involved in cell wall biosynthesis
MRYVRHPNAVNRGISASRNLGIRHASGELVAFMDADDVWLQEKLARHIQLLGGCPAAGMMYGRTEYWHSWTGNSEDKHRDHVPSLGIPADTLLRLPRC